MLSKLSPSYSKSLRIMLFSKIVLAALQIILREKNCWQSSSHACLNHPSGNKLIFNRATLITLLIFFLFIANNNHHLPGTGCYWGAITKDNCNLLTRFLNWISVISTELKIAIARLGTWVRSASEVSVLWVFSESLSDLWVCQGSVWRVPTVCLECTQESSRVYLDRVPAWLESKWVGDPD